MSSDFYPRSRYSCSHVSWFQTGWLYFLWLFPGWPFTCWAKCTENVPDRRRLRITSCSHIRVIACSCAMWVQPRHDSVQSTKLLTVCLWSPVKRRHVRRRNFVRRPLSYMCKHMAAYGSDIDRGHHWEENDTVLFKRLSARSNVAREQLVGAIWTIVEVALGPSHVHRGPSRPIVGFWLLYSFDYESVYALHLEIQAERIFSGPKLNCCVTKCSRKFEF